MHPIRTIRVVDPTDVLWKRVGAFLIDETLYLALVWLTTELFAGWAGTAATLVTAAALWAAALVTLQGVTGATPGKFVCGLRVVTAEGEPCGPARSAVRSAAWIVDGFPYVLPLTAYAAAIGDAEAQRLGDRAAGTYVIDRRFLGQAPHSIAFPADGSEPYRMTTLAPYLPTSAANPLKRGTVAAEVAALPHGAPNATLAPNKPGTEPVYDPDLRGYKRWDAVHNTWAVFDESSRQWQPAPVTATRA